MGSLTVSAWLLAAIAAAMLLETARSARNVRRLRARGARDVDDGVYRWMAIVYPASFLVMAAEGFAVGPPTPSVQAAGVAVFAAAKALKYAAIASLGPRWSFRVLVLPGEPLVHSGPYRLMRHPNYVGVMGELVGTAIAMGAIVTGPVALVTFGFLLRRRVAAEERALGLASGGRTRRG